MHPHQEDDVPQMYPARPPAHMTVWDWLIFLMALMILVYALYPQ